MRWKLLQLGYSVYVPLCTWDTKSIFKECNMNKSLEQQDLASFKFSNDSVLNVGERAIIYYIASIGKALAR